MVRNILTTVKYISQYKTLEARLEGTHMLREIEKKNMSE